MSATADPNSQWNAPVKGRGTGLAPQNRFVPIAVVPDFEHFEHDFDELLGDRKVPTQFLVDASQSIISENSSPDVPFRFSLNPYRGCEHGCAYCYARPYHEYLGLNAGVDLSPRFS